MTRFAAKTAMGSGLALLLGGCVPVVPGVTPGFVSMTSGQPRSSDLQLQVQGGGMCLNPCEGGVDGAAHVDVYASETTSVPISASVGYLAGSNLLAIPMRIGIRHRFDSMISLGVGGGPSLMIPTVSGTNVLGGGSVDLEVGYGRAFSQGAISAVLRPGVAFTPNQNGNGSAIVFPAEVSGIYYLSDALGVGGSVAGGYGPYFYNHQATGIGAITGSVSVVFRHRSTH